MSVNIIQHWNKFKNFLLNKNIDQSISSNNSVYIDNSIQQVKSQNSIYTNNKIHQLSSENSNYVIQSINSNNSNYVDIKIFNANSNQSSFVNNVVNGSTTFYTTSRYQKKSTDIDLTDSSVLVNNVDGPGIIFRDKNNTVCGKFGIYRTSDSRFIYYMHIPANVYNNNKDAGIRFYVGSNGSVYARCSVNPDIISSDDQIATTKFVHDRIYSELNATNGLQFNGIYRKIYPGIDLTKTPSTNYSSSIILAEDKNRTIMSKILNYHNADKSLGIVLQIQPSLLSNNAANQIFLWIDKDGNRKISLSQTPSTNANNNQVATTAFVNNLLNSKDVVTSWGSSGSGYEFRFYRKYKSGFIINGGKTSSNAATYSGSTITFLTPFNNSNTYIVLATTSTDAVPNDYNTVIFSSDKQKTSFKIHAGSSSNTGGKPAYWLAMGY